MLKKKGCHSRIYIIMKIKVHCINKDLSLYRILFLFTRLIALKYEADFIFSIEKYYIYMMHI